MAGAVGVTIVTDGELSIATVGAGSDGGKETQIPEAIGASTDEGLPSAGSVVGMFTTLVAGWKTWLVGGAAGSIVALVLAIGEEDEIERVPLVSGAVVGWEAIVGPTSAVAVALALALSAAHFEASPAARSPILTCPVDVGASVV